MAAAEIDDRQSTHADCAWTVVVKAVIVGPPMDDRLAHSPDRIRRRLSAIEMQYSVDAAHDVVPRSGHRRVSERRSRGRPRKRTRARVLECRRRGAERE